MAINLTGQPQYVKDLLAWPNPYTFNNSTVTVNGPFSWTGNANQGAVVKFSFVSPTFDSAFGSGRTALTDLQKDSARAAFAYYEQVGSVDFQEVTSNPDLVLAKTQMDADGYFLPHSVTGGNNLESADLFFDIDLDASSVPGIFANTALHEIGHVLGLSHPKFDAYDSAYNNDTTVMSYNFGATYTDVLHLASYPSVYDIAAAQFLYGAKTSVNSTGTLYDSSIINGTHHYWTIWDGGGTDTIDASGRSDAVLIDLRGGAKGLNVPVSHIGDEYFAIAFDPTQFNPDGTLKPGKSGSGVVDIEIAKGGAGNDTIVGGYAANTLEGGAGDDVLIEPFTGDTRVNFIYGGIGNDKIYGGANLSLQGGGDFLYGGPGVDTIWMNAGIAEFENDGTGTGETFIAWTGSNSIRRSDPNATTDINGIKVVVNPEGAFVEVAMGQIGANNTLRIGNVEIKGSFAAPVTHATYGQLWSLGNGWWIEGNTSQIIVRDSKYRAVAELDEWQSGDFGITLTTGAGPSANLAAIGALLAADRPDFVTPYLMPALQGTAANDTIQGTNLADNIVLLAGNDTGNGGVGNDTVSGGDGTNKLEGGADKDTFIIALASAAFTDTITDFNAAAGEMINLSALGSNLALNLTQTGANVSFTLGNRTVTLQNVVGASLALTNFVGVTSLSVKVTPTSGAESIPGTAGNDTIDALGGDDTVSGLAGNDSLIGNSGNDVLDGGAGADNLNGGTGTDTASYATSNAAVVVSLLAATASGGHAAGDVLTSIENLTGSAFADTLTGNTSANVLSGGAGNDTLLGDSGSDTLDGGDGNDSQDGGSSNDLLWASVGADTILGGTGNDTFDFSRSTAGVVVNLTTNVHSGGYAAGDKISGVEHLIGTAYADSLTGSVDNNQLTGGLGNDTIAGGAGRDTLDGGDGNDSLYGGADSDRITDASGTNQLFGDAGTDSLVGGAGADKLFGGTENDTLEGGAGNDSLSGDDGDDSIKGGAGTDTIAGGAGVDTLTYSSATAGVKVNLATGIGNSNDAAGDIISGIEKLIGSSYADTLTGSINADTITGGNGNNTLSGDAGNDSLVGGTGLDTIKGGAGADTIDGGSGNDSLLGGTENDSILGGSGNDVLLGEAGNDLLKGETGTDTMTGGLGADIYYFGVSDAGLGVAADHITAFSRSDGDKIQFSISGIAATGFVGTGAFVSGGAREFGYTKVTNGSVLSTVVRIDYTNDGVTDREIVLDNLHIDLVAGDFLF